MKQEKKYFKLFTDDLYYINQIYSFLQAFINIQQECIHINTKKNKPKCSKISYNDKYTEECISE